MKIPVALSLPESTTNSGCPISDALLASDVGNHKSLPARGNRVLNDIDAIFRAADHIPCRAPLGMKMACGKGFARTWTTDLRIAAFESMSSVPAPINTSLLNEAFANPDDMKALASTVVMGRLGRPEESRRPFSFSHRVMPTSSPASSFRRWRPGTGLAQRLRLGRPRLETLAQGLSHQMPRLRSINP